MSNIISDNNLKEINGGADSSNRHVPAYQIVSGLEGYDTIHYLEACDNKETAKANAIDYATKLLGKCKSYVFVNYFVYEKINNTMTKVEEGSVTR